MSNKAGGASRASTSARRGARLRVPCSEASERWRFTVRPGLGSHARAGHGGGDSFHRHRRTREHRHPAVEDVEGQPILADQRTDFAPQHRDLVGTRTCPPPCSRAGWPRLRSFRSDVFEPRRTTSRTTGCSRAASPRDGDGNVSSARTGAGGRPGFLLATRKRTMASSPRASTSMSANDNPSRRASRSKSARIALCRACSPGSVRSEFSPSTYIQKAMPAPARRASSMRCNSPRKRAPPLRGR